jgi:hypothetical protein
MRHPMWVLVVLAALCAASADAVSAATYYISASDPNASDSNSGLSAAAPWRTLEKLHASWDAITPGDSVLLERGDYWAPSFPGTYRPGVITPTFNKSGTADAYITLGAYGTGRKPVISRRNRLRRTSEVRPDPERNGYRHPRPGITATSPSPAIPPAPTDPITSGC